MRFTRQPTPQTARYQEPPDPDADLAPRRRRMLRIVSVVLSVLALAFIGWISQVRGHAVVLGNEVPMRARISGAVTWVAPQGAHLEKGDPVAQLDTTMVELQLDEAKAELEAARAALELERREQEQRLAELRARQEEARVQLAKAREQASVRRANLDFEQYRSETTRALYERQLVAEREHQDAQRERRVLQIATRQSGRVLRSRREQLKRLDMMIEAHFRVMAQRTAHADAQIATLERKVAQQREQVQAGRILAPMDGVVARSFVPEGSYVTHGDVLMTMLDGSDLSVAVFVSERDLGNVALAEHEKVKVRFNAHPLSGVSGQVVERYARLSSGIQQTMPGLPSYAPEQPGMVLASRVRLGADVPFTVRPGMTGTVILERRGPFWIVQTLIDGVLQVMGW